MDTQYVKGDSIFTKLNKNHKQYPYLQEDIETDVLIVGGGVTGAIMAYYFSKNNINTVILEKGRIAHLSTGITTSLLQYELDSNVAELMSYTKLSNVKRSYELGVKAINEIDNIINLHGNKCDYHKVDTLLYSNKELEIDEMKKEYDFRKEWGLDVEYITSQNNPYEFELKAGVRGIDGGIIIDPFKFTHEILNVSVNNGAKVYENTEVTEINYNSTYATANTVYGNKVKCKIVIIATGYDTEGFSKRNFGVKTTTFNIATSSISNMPHIYKKTVIRDNKQPYNYLRTTEDNRIIIGGEDINFVPDIENEYLCQQQYMKLKTTLKRMFPNLNYSIDYKYCGAFASTQDNLGFIGPDPFKSMQWYALGYGANGILFAILAGLMLSDKYLGHDDPDMNLFSITRFDN